VGQVPQAQSRRQDAHTARSAWQYPHVYLFTALNPNKIEPSNKGLDKSPRFV